jgi:hypothetical protein
MERRTALQAQIEAPRLARVDVRENASRDATDIEHVRERVHTTRLALRLLSAHARAEQTKKWAFQA